MRTFVVLTVCGLVVTVAGAASVRAQVAATPKPCATVSGPAWTQTINLTGYLAPPKKPDLREIQGTRYIVFVDHVRCAWAVQRMSRLFPLTTRRQVDAAAPTGYRCGIGSKHWFIDGWNGDFVRRTTPPSSIGGCSTQKNDPVPGVTHHTFWWRPAKPCRSKGFQGDCHKA